MENMDGMCVIMNFDLDISDSTANSPGELRYSSTNWQTVTTSGKSARRSILYQKVEKKLMSAYSSGTHIPESFFKCFAG